MRVGGGGSYDYDCEYRCRHPPYSSYYQIEADVMEYMMRHIGELIDNGSVLVEA